MRSVFVCCMLMIICFLCLPYESFCEDRQFQVCKDRVCGNLSIRFPFYTDENFRYCGYPGFGLTCLNNDVLLLNISEAQYRITEIFYTNNSFRVSNILSSRSGFCSLDKIRNLSLPNDGRFQLKSFVNLTLLSNCTQEPPPPPPPQILSRYKVGCDQGKNDSDWVLAMKTNDPELIYATAACKTVAVAPIRDFREDDPDYLKMIRNGFDLEWVATNCSDCTTSGGYCGYIGAPDNKFQCFCDDRPHSRSCKPTKATNNSTPVCPNSFSCQNFGNLSFPFYMDSTDRRCGLCKLKFNEPVPKLQLGGQLYDVKGLNQTSQEIQVHGQALQNLLDKKDCASFSSIYLPNSPSISFTINKIALFKCPENLNCSLQNYTFQKCTDYNLYYRYPVHHRSPVPEELQYYCSVIKLPLSTVGNISKSTRLFELLTANFTLKFHISPQCSKCHSRGGECVTDEKYCIGTKEKHTENKTRLAVLLGTAVPGACIIVILGVIYILWRRKQLKQCRVERDSSADIEDGTSYFGVPVFSYKELEEATHNFDPAKELGDGGFGTVYYGKLRDGRDVAVKRCYENNYRRVEQFMNEIHILTLLRHRNLVILYGSTSHRSRDLLLVYEYIANGTLADHIHGDRSTNEPLIWSVRMNIAIEIASALSYLHKSDIIHRDVKTNNILLDNNFCVKVADFGLSRLFPTDVTHVSTAPQGTPGYVDPEYHQCYQLTDKSDVYSFGVVLVELISSLPAVDINRQRNEINLANLAIDRIQKCAIHELIDPFLGQEPSTEMMTTSVAELAFRCLQLDKDLRPTMDEVLECLEQIQGAHLPKSSLPPPSPEMEDVVLLKKNTNVMDSPVSVADKWISTSTTPSISK